MRGQPLTVLSILHLPLCALINKWNWHNNVTSFMNDPECCLAFLSGVLNRAIQAFTQGSLSFYLGSSQTWLENMCNRVLTCLNVFQHVLTGSDMTSEKKCSDNVIFLLLFCYYVASIAINFYTDIEFFCCFFTDTMEVG